MHARALGVIAIAIALAGAGCVAKHDEHRIRANAMLRGGDPAAALKEIETGLADKPQDLPLLILDGKALFELDRFADSQAAYQKALDVGAKEDPRSLSEAYLGLGMAASRQGDWATARRAFEALVRPEVNDRDASSHLNVARACLALKDYPCAIDHGEQAGHLRGNDEAVLYTLGTIYLAADKPADAETTFQHICDVVPAAASCPYGLALVAAKQGDKPKALAKLRDAVAKKIPNPDQIATDPGFASIKDDPDFQQLAASTKK